MSDAPWLALTCDWMDSDQFDDATAGGRLAWVCLLCHVKAYGRAGRAKVREKSFCDRYQLSARSYQEMLKNALADKAIEVDGNYITLVNWRHYQNPASKHKGGKSGELPHGRKKAPTNHQGPSTKDQSPVPPPNPPQGGDEREAGKVVTKRRERCAKCTRQQAEFLYRLYPRHVGKDAAIKAIQRAVKRLAGEGDDDPLGTLTRAVGEYAESPAGQPPPSGEDYRPHPATWFNQGRYADDRAAWRKPNGKAAEAKPDLSNWENELL